MRHIALCLLFTGSLTCTLSAQEWSILSSGTTVTLMDVHFLDEMNGFVVGDGGTVLKTADGGSTWEDISPVGVADALNAVHFFDDQTGIVAGAGGVMERTTNGGSTWEAVTSGVRDQLHALSFAGERGICGGSALDILSSSDAGASWEFVDGGYFCGSNYGAFQLDSLSAYVAGDNCIFQPLIQWTNDGGATWNFAVFYLNGNEGTLRDVFFHDVNNGFVVSTVFTGEGGISQTVNGGAEWTTTLYPDGLYGLDFPSVDVGYAVGLNGAILRTSDGGISWESETAGTSVWLTAVSFVNGETGFAVGQSGTILKRSGDGGVPCEDIGPFQAKCKPDRSIRARVILPNSTIHAGKEVIFGVDGTNYPVVVETNGTHSRALLTLADQHPGYHTVSLEEPADCFNPIIIICDTARPALAGDWQQEWSVEDQSEPVLASRDIPVKTTMIGNYPNPFNPSTTINYAIAEDSPVTVQVYDMLGQLIATLVDEFQSAGVRSVTWNGVDDTGNPVSSGLYVYVLRSSDVVTSGKMMLMK